MEKNRIKLSNNQIELLENLPEQGMGFQIVNIEMTDGSILTKRLVFNSMFLQLNTDEKFCANDILKIELYKN